MCLKKVVNSAAQVIFAADRRVQTEVALCFFCLECVWMCGWRLLQLYGTWTLCEELLSRFYRETESKSCYFFSRKSALYNLNLHFLSSVFKSLRSKATFLIFKKIFLHKEKTQVSASHDLFLPVRWPCPTPQPVASGRAAFQSYVVLVSSSSWVK